MQLAIFNQLATIPGGPAFIAIIYFFGAEIRTLLVYIVVSIYEILKKIFDDTFLTTVIITDPKNLKTIKKAMNMYQTIGTSTYEVSYDLYDKKQYRIEAQLDLNSPFPFVFNNYCFYLKEIDETKLEIKCSRFFDKDRIQDFINDCQKKIPESKLEDDFQCAEFMQGKWCRIKKLNKIDPETAFISDDTKDILDDFETFVNDADLYLIKNKPYRRGYLLYGPPGTGKTTCVKLMSIMYGYEIWLLSLNQPSLNDEGLKTAILQAPNKCIIVIEDVDHMTIQNESGVNSASTMQRQQMLAQQQQPIKALSLSTLLNILDGISTKSNTVFFITTNNIEGLKKHLDESFFRPGRIDVAKQIGLLQYYEIVRYYRHVYKNIFKNERFHPKIDKYADLLEKKIAKDVTMSLAQLQNFLEPYGVDYKNAYKAFISKYPSQIDHQDTSFHDDSDKESVVSSMNESLSLETEESLKEDD